MSNKFTSLLALGAGFAIALAASGTAQAAQFTYDFSAKADSGPFAGEMAKGFFSFNDDEPPARTDSSSNFYSLSQAEVKYAGTTYTLADADAPIEAATSLADGTFLGLSYTSTTLPVSVVSGLTNANQGFFTYEAYGESGTGSFSYSLREDQPPESVPESSESVPEPSVLIGLGLMSAAFLMKKNLRVKAPQFSA